VIKHIRWQILLVLVGIGLLITLLVYVALNFTTVWVASSGGTYVEGLAGSPQFINPLLCQTYEADSDLCALVFNGLTRMSYDGTVVPDLAESWEVSPDGSVYTFHLRRGVRWHDRSPFTAADVVFTIKLLQDPNFPGRADWGELWRAVTVTQVDDYTVRFELDAALAPFLDYTTVGILPSHLLQDVSASALLDHPFNLQPVGTGIYSVGEVVTTTGRISNINLNANPFYFRQRPSISRIQFKFYPSYQAVYQAYLDGQVQGIGRVAAENLSEAQANPDLKLFTSILPRYSLIYLNLRSESAPFFAEQEVRQALMYALDRQALIDQVLDGQGVVADGPILPSSWAYTPTLSTMYTYDPARAMALLEQAGWEAPAIGDTAALTSTANARAKEGRSLSFSLLVRDDPTRIAIAQEIARQWGSIGVQANVEPVVTGLVSERLKPRQYEAALVELDLTLTGDPDPYTFWHQTQIEPPYQNYAGYDNRDASEILEEARLVTDQQTRKELYYKFQRLFAQDVPAIFLYHPVYTYAVDRYVRGVNVGPIVRPGDRFLDVAEWYVRLRRVIRSDASAEGLEPITP
jgi:peptide/nickel transport system substrate-binding protein